MRNCFLLLIFISSVSFAQSNFKPGVIVTLSGDSVKGTIDDQLWRRNPTSVKFREGNNEKVYGIGEIRAFTVTGKVAYESYRVRYDSSHESGKRLAWSHLPYWKESCLFLKVLVSGKYTLYRFVEVNDRIHYFIGNGGKVEELVNHRFLLNGTVQVNRQYVDQLKVAFSDCPSVKIGPTLRYDEGSLVKVFEKYAACTGSTVATSKQEKTLVGFGVVGTLGWDQLGGNPVYKASAGYGVGGFVNFMFPGKLYKWSAYTEIAYRKFGEQISTAHPKRVDIASIKVSVLARNHFNIGKLRSFVQAGGAYSSGVPDEAQNYSGVSQFKSRLWSGVAGAGVVINNNGRKGPKVIVDARIEYGNGIEYLVTINKHMSAGLSVGIQF
jgi:hypothetical protein